jgi:CheY-like chemotaxis protein
VSAVPTVYFIDDSATMREVIKIAFRRENINVVAYNDAASALSQIELQRPDVVITDVIMPEKDGYEVCQYIKQSQALSSIPVILMSGVVNRSVAEKAFSVKADELIRKPFQPQDLITRVRHLLKPQATAPAAPMPAPAPVVQAPVADASAALSSIFQTPINTIPAARAPRPAMAPQAAPVQQAATPQAAAAAPAPARPAMTSPDAGKMRLEIMRLEGLVKKLQSELVAEREYAKALEEHVKTLQESE